MHAALALFRLKRGASCWAPAPVALRPAGFFPFICQQVSQISIPVRVNPYFVLISHRHPRDTSRSPPAVPPPSQVSYPLAIFSSHGRFRHRGWECGPQLLGTHSVTSIYRHKSWDWSVSCECCGSTVRTGRLGHGGHFPMDARGQRDAGARLAGRHRARHEPRVCFPFYCLLKIWLSGSHGRASWWPFKP